ncbi:MAG: c-type cytochrome [Vulcanococcus sp.]|jgi:cytochrome c6
MMSCFASLARLLCVALLLLGLSAPSKAWAADGAQLFEMHCAGCHVNGGNIIRRGKTLKMAALQRQGVDSAEAIAVIAAQGQGQMSGYGEVLGAEGVEAVAAWVWQQSQADWPKS